MGKLKKTRGWQDRPATDGYYWLNVDGKINVVEVDISYTLMGTQVYYMTDTASYDLCDITGKWYGPIEPPPEGE